MYAIKRGGYIKAQTFCKHSQSFWRKNFLPASSQIRTFLYTLTKNHSIQYSPLKQKCFLLHYIVPPTPPPPPPPPPNPNSVPTPSYIWPHAIGPLKYLSLHLCIFMNNLSGREKQVVNILGPTQIM